MGVSNDDVPGVLPAKDQQQTAAKIVPASQRSALKARTEDVNLNKMIGKKVNVSEESLDSESNTAITPEQLAGMDPSKAVVAGVGGFFCRVCNLAIKDSNSYLDHINSRKRM